MINTENCITRTGWRLTLIPFRPTSPFYTSWNHQKTRSFQDAYNCNIGLKWVKNGKLFHVSPKKCQHKYHLAFSFYPQLNPRKKLVRVVEIMQLETATGVMSNKIKSDKYIKDWNINTCLCQAWVPVPLWHRLVQTSRAYWGRLPNPKNQENLQSLIITTDKKSTELLTRFLFLFQRNLTFPAYSSFVSYGIIQNFPKN